MPNPTSNSNANPHHHRTGSVTAPPRCFPNVLLVGAGKSYPRWRQDLFPRGCRLRRNRHSPSTTSTSVLPQLSYTSTSYLIRPVSRDKRRRDSKILHLRHSPYIFYLITRVLVGVELWCLLLHGMCAIRLTRRRFVAWVQPAEAITQLQGNWMPMFYFSRIARYVFS